MRGSLDPAGGALTPTPCGSQLPPSMQFVDVRARLQRLTGMVRNALRSGFDQSKPFGRLAMVHTLMSAGSTAVTVGLAGTLFFSISLKEAESKVLLYLLITIAPFAVVAPALSPLLDRGRQARRSAVVAATGGSALVCIAMVRDVKGLLLFPEAFGILVLSKLYLVARAALVPAVTAPGDDLATANAHLAVLSALAGFAISPIAIGFLQIGAGVVMGLAGVVFLAAAVAAFRLPKIDATAPASAPTAPSRYGVAGVAPGQAAAYGPPAPPGGLAGSGYSGRAGGEYQGASLGGGGAGAGAGTAPGVGGPGGMTSPAGTPAPAASSSREERLSTREVRARRKALGLGRYHPVVLSGFTAMCVVRGSVGFVTFFLAFALKRDNAAAWWYGFIVLASGVGGLAGSMVVPLMRRRLSEERIILGALVVGALFALSAALIGGMWAQPLLTFVIGLSGTSAKPSFDSLVQREVPALMQGRAFARFETWLQLVWVAAALLAVIVHFGLGDGDVVVAVACGTAACFYASMRHTAHRHDATLPSPSPAG
jgi:hypothetical protein